MSKKYWIQNSYDGTNFVKSVEEPSPVNQGWWEGPFNTLTEAKEAAYKYHRAIKEQAEYNRDKVRNTKVKDVEEF